MAEQPEQDLVAVQFVVTCQVCDESVLSMNHFLPASKVEEYRQIVINEAAANHSQHRLSSRWYVSTTYLK